MRPASAGPAISVSWKLSWFSARPAGSWLAGSRPGTNVARAGRSRAVSEDWTATRAYSSQTSPSPAKAWAANAADTAARQLLVTSTSFRRSMASVIVPPASPMSSVGTICATPTPPTASGE